MKKTLLCLAVAIAMVLAMPTALFATDNLVNADGSTANQLEADNGSSTDWAPATVWNLLDNALLSAAATVDESIVTEEDDNVVVYGDNGSVGGDGEFRQVSTSTNSIGATRYSGTRGNVSAYASFNRKASTAECVMILQQKSGGSWVIASGIPVKAYRKTVYNKSSIAAGRTFTLKSGKVYRARITFIDTNSSGTYTKSRTTGAF